MKKYIPLIIVILFMVSCEKDSTTDDLTSKVVVEAIMPQGKIIEISITKEILFKQDTNEVNYIDDLLVTLSDGNEQFTLENQGNGIYTSNNVIEIENIYYLSFNYNNQEISSQTTVPSKPESFSSSVNELEIEPITGPPTSLENVELTWENNDGSYYLVVVNCIEENPDPIYDTDNVRVFRSEPLVADYYEIRQMQFQYYGMHEIILFKINPDYAALYEESGDNSLSIKTPFSNIDNGLGIFTAINSDTLYLNVVN